MGSVRSQEDKLLRRSRSAAVLRRALRTEPNDVRVEFREAAGLCGNMYGFPSTRRPLIQLMKVQTSFNFHADV